MDERLEFLRAVLPENQGLYCITTITRPDSFGKTHTKNLQFADLNAAIMYADNIKRTANVYFALSSYKADVPFARKAANAQAQKSFWIDLDCDPEKAETKQAYATKKEALVALHEFCKTTTLPVPTIVDSGNGFHCYWVLSKSIPTDYWKKIAQLWRKCIKNNNLVVDHHRTCDAASILRMPGTFNHKHAALEVKIIYSQKEYIKPADFLRKIMSLDVQSNGHTSLNSSAGVPTSLIQGMPAGEFSFGGNFGSNFTDFSNMPPRSCKQMIVKCRQIREMATSKYPAWFLAIRTLLHTENSHAWIHALSKRDPVQYDEEYTDEQIEHCEADTSYGPALCESFDSVCPSKCEGCPFKGKIKSPISLCEPVAPKPVVMPSIPVEHMDLTGGEIALGDATETKTFEPYSDNQFQVTPGKGIFKTEVDENSVPHSYQISPYEIYIHTLCVDYTQGSTPKRTYIMRKVVPGCAPVDIPFAIEDALGTQKLEQWTAQCGLLPAPKDKKDFFNFMNTYISAIQNKLPEVYVRNHFGWINCTDRATGKTYQGFIVGQDMYSDRGKSQVRLDERAGAVATKLGIRGSLADWLKVPQLYSKLNQKFAQLLMCTAFGAPLMRFGRGTATNVAYNFWDINGGKGKSSMLKAIASVWGDPQQMLMGRTDTHAARFQHFAVYRNLPILVDEMTGISDDETASMLYDIVNGREKARSTSTGTGLAQSGKWDTITIFTANQSMYESLKQFRSQSSATCMRLIENECDFSDYSNDPATVRTINEAMAAARDNYGIAGSVFIQYVTSHLSQIQQLVETYAEKFATKYAKSSDERFWLYGIAIPLVAGRVAKILKLIDYDIDELENYCVNELLPQLRDKVKSNKPTGYNLLTDFLNDNLASTLIVRACNRREWENIRKNSKPEDRGTFGNIGSVADPYIVQLPTQKLLIRYELDTHSVHISSRALATWCRAHGVSLDSLLKGLTKQGQTKFGINTRRVSLGKFVDVLPNTTQTVYTFSYIEKGEEKEND